MRRGTVGVLALSGFVCGVRVYKCKDLYILGTKWNSKNYLGLKKNKKNKTSSDINFPFTSTNGGIYIIDGLNFEGLFDTFYTLKDNLKTMWIYRCYLWNLSF